MHRCLNHIFGYCATKPEQTVIDSYRIEYDYQGQLIRVPCSAFGCKHDYHSCKHYLTLFQSFALSIPLATSHPHT